MSGKGHMSTHTPMLGDLTILHAENVAGGEAYWAPGWRNTEIGTLVRARVDEARGYMVLIGNHDFDCDF